MRSKQVKYKKMCVKKRSEVIFTTGSLSSSSSTSAGQKQLQNAHIIHKHTTLYKLPSPKLDTCISPQFLILILNFLVHHRQRSDDDDCMQKKTYSLLPRRRGEWGLGVFFCGIGTGVQSTMRYFWKAYYSYIRN